jgi:hypothetical protein
MISHKILVNISYKTSGGLLASYDITTAQDWWIELSNMPIQIRGMGKEIKRLDKIVRKVNKARKAYIKYFWTENFKEHIFIARPRTFINFMLHDCDRVEYLRTNHLPRPVEVNVPIVTKKRKK